MKKHFVTFTLLIAVTAASSAQRHGRGDGLQNYLRGGPAEQHLLLQVRVAGKRLYFRHADFKKMYRSQIAVADPATGITHTYGGVNLEELVPGASLSSAGSRFETSYGHKQKAAFLVADLDPDSKPLVVDTLDGKHLTGYIPYYLVIKARERPISILTAVDEISVLSSQQDKQ